jgi:hypothetical protein
MTLAELMLLAGGGIALYFLLRPLQRWLERLFVRAIVGRRRPVRPPIIDVTDFSSHSLPRKDRHENHS